MPSVNAPPPSPCPPIPSHFCRVAAQLPDGRVIKIGRERFEAAEALFKPDLVDLESKGMGDMVYEMIQVTD